MEKRSRQSKNVIRGNELYMTIPWSFTNFGNQSEIEAYIASTGKWETIADVKSVHNIDAEEIAEFIIQAVNYYANRRNRDDLGDEVT